MLPLFFSFLFVKFEPRDCFKSIAVLGSNIYGIIEIQPDTFRQEIFGYRLPIRKQELIAIMENFIEREVFVDKE